MENAEKIIRKACKTGNRAFFEKLRANKIYVRVKAAAVVVISAAILYCVIRFYLGSPEDRLVTAASNDDLAGVKKMAAKGASLDSHWSRATKWSALIVSTLSDGTNVFFYLLKAGVKVEEADQMGGLTALMYAARDGDKKFDKTQALIAAGANVNAIDEAGTSVLDWANAGAGVNTNTIRLLEQNGAKRVHSRTRSQ
jgi:hypothetical protein